MKHAPELTTHSVTGLEYCRRCYQPLVNGEHPPTGANVTAVSDSERRALARLARQIAGALQ